MNKTFSFLILLAFPLSCSTPIPDRLEPLFSYYDSESNDKLGVPLSGAFLVMDSTSILSKKMYGTVHPVSSDEITEDTKFYIGSLTKQFTAMIILQLFNESKLDLHVPVSTYLTTYKESYMDSITVHQLLSHTSGLPHYPVLLNHGYTPEEFLKTPLTVDEYVEIISTLKLEFRPGSRLNYSSFGYILLGAIIEEVTSSEFSQQLNERISEPLGLKNTGYQKEHLKTGFAEDYRVSSKGLFSNKKYTLVEERALSNAYSAGGMYSSINDLSIWITALKKSSLINEELQNLMFSAVEEFSAYGFFINDEQFLRDDVEVQLISHGGEIMGYKSIIAMYDDGISIIALFNTSPLKRIESFINQIHLATNNRSERRKPFIHPSLSNRTNFEREGGIEAFKKYHSELSKRAGYKILPSESTISHVLSMYLDDTEYKRIESYMKELLDSDYVYPEAFLNTIGYTFLEYQKYELATAFFEKNITLHPNSPNVYDSIGELYETKGDYTLAKEYYSRAIQKSFQQYSEPDVELFQTNLKRVSND